MKFLEKMDNVVRNKWLDCDYPAISVHFFNIAKVTYICVWTVGYLAIIGYLI